MSRSLLRQLEQMRGTVDFVDDMYYAYAEQAGRHYLEGTLTVTSGSTAVTDSTNLFDRDEVDNFIVVDESEAAGVYQIVSATGTNDATITPAASGTGSVSYRRHYYQNLEDDLNYIRKMLKLVIGESEWNDEPNTDLFNMAYLIPKRPNYVGETTQYDEGLGTVSYSITDIDQQGYVSGSQTSEDYMSDVGSTSTTSGTQLYFTDDNTIVVTCADGFYPADKGTLSILRDGQTIASINLLDAWTNQGGVYHESEADMTASPIPDYTADASGIDITNRRPMNTTEGFPNFWPPYQLAAFTYTMTLPEGFVGQITVSHSEGNGPASGRQYSRSSFWVDTTSQTITASAPTISENSATTRYLSGVPYYTSGSVFNVSASNSDTLFDEGYVTNPLTLNLSQFNASSQTPSLATIGLSTPVDTTDTIGTYNTTCTVGASNFRDLDARATATFRNVFTTSTSSDSAAGTYRIDTYSTTSTDTSEPFDDEDKRFVGLATTESMSSSSVDYTDSDWDSSLNVVSGAVQDDSGDEHLVVYNGTLKYPTINHSSGFLPAGPDYSSASGDHVYYRLFKSTGAFTQGTITFSGWSDALSVIQGANVDVYLMYPGCSDYGNNNTSTWQNLSVDQTTYGGNGCLGSGSSGSTVAFSFGTTSSVGYGNRVFIKIVFHNSSVTALTGLTFSPTL